MEMPRFMYLFGKPVNEPHVHTVSVFPSHDMSSGTIKVMGLAKQFEEDLRAVISEELAKVGKAQ